MRADLLFLQPVVCYEALTNYHPVGRFLVPLKAITRADCNGPPERNRKEKKEKNGYVDYTINPHMSTYFQFELVYTVSGRRRRGKKVQTDLKTDHI